MADLIDRLSGDSTDMIPFRQKIPIHDFLARMILYAGGKMTRVEATVGLDLQGEELTQATALANAVDSKPANQKVPYVLMLMAVCYQLEIPENTVYRVPITGELNKTLIKLHMELP